MHTNDSQVSLDTKMSFLPVGRRRVEADFSAGHVSSDGGALLLREADERLSLTNRMAACFVDHRNERLIEHSVRELLAQRIYGIALGYEDLNDHETFSRDPLVATAVGKTDPTGALRRLERDRGQGLASASTLGRLERTKEDASRSSRYEKIVCDLDALANLFVQLFIESFQVAPSRLVIDLDPSDIQLHGEQEERHFHAHYGEHCYLPLYAYCGEHPLAVLLRPSNIDGAAGAVELTERLVRQIRGAFPDTHIILRGDSGFCRDALLTWCEDNGVDYVIGVPRNKRLERAIASQLEWARRAHLRTGRPERCFRDFRYRTEKSWSRTRRVVGKAEHLAKGKNPRFVVTSLPAAEFGKRYLYEALYCARGEMENRIKEQQLDLFGDRASSHTFRGNSIRCSVAMAAHILITAIRRVGLRGTELATAQANTIRTKLFKVGALVTVSVRRVYCQLSSACPLQHVFRAVLANLRRSTA